MLLPRNMIIPAAAIAMFAGDLLPQSVHAQTTMSKIAIANPVRIFNDLEETKQLRTKLQSDLSNLDQQRITRQNELKDLQSARDLLRTDSQQYADANQKLVAKSIEFETWAKITQADLQRQQKNQIKSLYDKISTAVQKVAEQKQIDLVIAQQNPELPADLEQITPDQLRQLLGSRNVLYNSTAVDISAAVTTAMDADFKAGK